MNDARGLSTRTHGNYAYQAPEVIKTLFEGDSSHACATRKSDIYCFGNILFEVRNPPLWYPFAVI